MKVRLFAALRDLAGASVVEVEGATTVGAVLDTLGERYGERFAAIVAAGSVVVDGDRAERDRPLHGGEEVALLPPVSGGARSAEGREPVVVPTERALEPMVRYSPEPGPILGEPQWNGSIASSCS